MALTFADRVNKLFEAFLQPPNEVGERLEWSNAQVARAAEKVYGRPVVAASALRSIRNGTRGHRPSAETAAAIARTFEYLSRSETKPGDASALVAYLVLDPMGPDTDAATIQTIHDQLDHAIQQRNARPRLVGLMNRLGDLEDEESVAAAEQLVEQLLATEQDKKRRGLLSRRKK